MPAGSRPSGFSIWPAFSAWATHSTRAGGSARWLGESWSPLRSASAQCKHRNTAQDLHRQTLRSLGRTTPHAQQPGLSRSLASLSGPSSSPWGHALLLVPLERVGPGALRAWLRHNLEPLGLAGPHSGTPGQRCRDAARPRIRHRKGCVGRAEGGELLTRSQSPGRGLGRVKRGLIRRGYAGQGQSSACIHQLRVRAWGRAGGGGAEALEEALPLPKAVAMSNWPAWPGVGR